MHIAKEDLLRIRELAAEKGSEFTPDQIVEILRKAKPDLIITNSPGLVSEIRKIKWQ